MNDFVHIFEFGPQRRAGYFSAVPVIKSINVLVSYWIRILIVVMTRVAKAYLDLEGVLFIFLIL